MVATDGVVKQFTRSITNIDRRLRIVENREMPTGGGTTDGLTQAQADLLYVNVTGADSMQGPLTIGSNIVGRSPDANNFLEWRTNGFYVPTIDLSPYATDADLAAHAAAADPHPVYATDADLAAHTAAANPHPVYLTQAEGDALYSVLTHTHDNYATDADLAAHVSAADPHPVYLTQAEADALYSILAHTHDIYATDADLAAHAAAADPHPVYLTQAEGEGLFLPLSHQPGTDPHPQYATDTDLANHATAANPHPVYLTQAEGDALYSGIAHNHDAAYVNVAGDTMTGLLSMPVADGQEALRFMGGPYGIDTIAGAGHWRLWRSVDGGATKINVMRMIYSISGLFVDEPLTVEGLPVRVSPAAGNALAWDAQGLFVAQGSIPISPDAGNILQMRANGLYVPMGLLFGRP